MDKTKKAVLIKDILPSVMGGLNPLHIQEQAKLEELWKKIAAKDAQKSVCVGVKAGCLFIEVDSPARLFHLRMKQQTLLTQLKMERADIQKIIFKIGKSR